MLALVAVLLAVWALSWAVLVCERGGPAHRSEPALPPPPASPHLTVAPGGTVIVAGRVTIVEAVPPDPTDRPAPMRFEPATRVAAAYGVLPPPSSR